MTMLMPYTGPGDDDDPLEQLKRIKAAEDADPLAQLKRLHPTPTSHKGVPFVDAKPESAPGVGTKVLGTLSALDADIPGAEAAQAGIRALIRQQPYREALSDIKGGEETAPAAARIPARIAGGTVAAMTLPGSAAMQGARYGILNALGSSDPDQGVNSRLHHAAIEGLIGAATGKVTDAAVTAGRGAFAKSLGRAALDRKAATEAADRAAYGVAEAEAALHPGPTPRAVTDALAMPEIAPYVKVIRTSPSMAGADDAKVLREAYKLMSERQGMLEGRINGKDFKAGTSLEQQDLGVAKRRLLGAAETPETRVTPEVTRQVPAETRTVAPFETAESPRPSLREAIDAFQRRQGAVAAREAQPGETVAQRLAREALERRGAEQEAGAISGSRRTEPLQLEIAPEFTETVVPEQVAAIDPLMPSFRGAVQQHAAAMGRRDAFRTAADATKRIIKNSDMAARSLEGNSPEAFPAFLSRLSPEEAQAAREGILGVVKKKNAPLHPLRTMTGAARITPYLRQVDAQLGTKYPSILRALGISAVDGR
jgi:hypothetical protein